MAVAVAPSDQAAYLRGKAFLGGLRGDAPLHVACDVVLALEVDGVPKDGLKSWRQAMDRQLMLRAAKPGKSGPDRDSWGLQAGQRQQMSKLTAGMKLPPGVVPTPLS